MKYIHPKKWKRLSREFLINFWNLYILPDQYYLKKQYFKSCGEKLNINNPQKLTEKIQWLKLHDRNPDYHLLVDKYEVKEIIAEKAGRDLVIPTYGVWTKFEDIDFDKLPNQFVLKCTHDSASVVICKDKKEFDFDFAKNKLNKALKFNYYRYENKQWAYKKIKPRIIAEKYLSELGNSELMDYKFYCFNGEPHFCQVIANRQTNETIDFYDKNWNHQNFIGILKFGDKLTFSETKQKMPENYDKMIRIAKILSENIPFVRVDLYNINGEIFFGEITFYPAGGVGFFEPRDWDLKLGQLLQLPKRY